MEGLSNRIFIETKFAVMQDLQNPPQKRKDLLQPLKKYHYYGDFSKPKGFQGGGIEEKLYKYVK